MPILLALLGGARSFLSSAFAFFSQPPGSWVGVALLACGIVWYAHHRGYNSGQSDAKAAFAKLEEQAVNAARVDQAARDMISQNEAIARAKSQAQIQTKTITLTKEIPVYVTAAQDRSTCITYGLVRVFNDAVGEADAIPVPAGKSYDACSPVKASDLARGITENFGTANDNADQLNKLEDWVRSQLAQNAKSAK